MKRFIISMMVVLILTTQSVYADENVKEKPHFRQAYWGTSKQEVKATLTDKDKIIDEADNGFAVKNADTSEYGILYCFTDDKLTHGAYVYDEEHYNKNKYIDEYGNMQDILTDKYGEPETDEWIWSDDLFKDDRGSWGLAMSIGHLTTVTEWNPTKEFYNSKLNISEHPKTFVTHIKLVAHGDNYEINLVILYESTEYYHLFEENEKQKNENNF